MSDIFKYIQYSSESPDQELSKMISVLLKVYK
jgi:hypothetical protein